MDSEQSTHEAVPAVSPKKPLPPSAMFALGLTGVVAAVAIVGYFVFMQKVKAVSANPTVVKFARILNVPAASINGKKILYTDYLEDVTTLKKFYGANTSDGQAGGPTDQQISDQVLSRLLANRLVGVFAEKYGVSVADADVQIAKDSILAQFPNEAAAEAELQKRYGWTLAMYVDKVIKPLLREQKLQETFASSTDEAGQEFEDQEIRARHILLAVSDAKDDASVKAQAERVLARALKGEDFAALAQEFGSDSTKDQGGDLGWFPRGVMVPEFEQAVFALSSGQIGKELVKTQFGYHIVKVEATRTARNFSKFMDAQLRSAAIKIKINVHNPFENLVSTDTANADLPAGEADNADAAKK